MFYEMAHCIWSGEPWRVLAWYAGDGCSVHRHRYASGQSATYSAGGPLARSSGAGAVYLGCSALRRCRWQREHGAQNALTALPNRDSWLVSCTSPGGDLRPVVSTLGHSCSYIVKLIGRLHGDSGQRGHLPDWQNLVDFSRSGYDNNRPKPASQPLNFTVCFKARSRH